MQIQPLKTHHMKPFESLIGLLDRYMTKLNEQTIVCITSKIVSLSQGRLVPMDQISKSALVHQEADLILDAPHAIEGMNLTIKNNLLIPAAGIDASNSAGHYILYPEQAGLVAAQLWAHLRGRHGVKELGVVITDTRSTPLRWGVTGLAIGWCGFKPLYSYEGKKDLDGRTLHNTHVSVVDCLATAAVLMMGEGDEQTPLAVITHAPKIRFMDRSPTQEEASQVLVSMENDIYGPLLKSEQWSAPSRT